MHIHNTLCIQYYQLAISILTQKFDGGFLGISLLMGVSPLIYVKKTVSWYTYGFIDQVNATGETWTSEALRSTLLLTRGVV